MSRYVFVIENKYLPDEDSLSASKPGIIPVKQRLLGSYSLRCSPVFVALLYMSFHIARNLLTPWYLRVINNAIGLGIVCKIHSLNTTRCLAVCMNVAKNTIITDGSCLKYFHRLISEPIR